MVEFTINDAAVAFDGDGTTPLLWALREHFGLPGTKFGCGIGQCGACTVHIDGQATRSCVTPIAAAAGKAVRTIEGLANGDQLHPVQQAWIELDVAQCGYCQAGQIMAAAALLERTPQPTTDQVRTQMTNLCRCGTYVRMEQAVLRAAAIKSEASS